MVRYSRCKLGFVTYPLLLLPVLLCSRNAHAQGADATPRAADQMQKEWALSRSSAEHREKPYLQSAAKFEQHPPVRKIDLEFAVEHDGVAAMRALLDRSDTAYTPEDLNSVLLLAVSRQSPEIVRMLLDRSADVNAADEYKRTALMIAASRNNQKILPLLLAEGARLSPTDAKGNTVIAYAASHDLAMKLLIKAGAQASRADLNTALIGAVRGENQFGVAYLLAHGADPNMRDNFLKCTTDMTSEQVRNHRGSRVVEMAKRNLAGAREAHDAQSIARCQRIVQLLQHKEH